MDRVEVWLSRPVTAPPQVLDEVLDDVEHLRARSMDLHEHAAFVTGRLLLRAALARALGCSPAAVRLDSSCRCGRPHGPVGVLPTGPWVSVTRHGPLVGVAVRAAGPVGLDLVSVAAVAAAPLTRVLRVEPAAADHPGPDGTLDGRTSDAHALAQAWARTEATLKMLRTGLRRDPSAVRIARSGLAHLDGRAVGRVVDLQLPPGPLDGDAIGAVAVDGDRAPQIVLRDGARLLDDLVPPERPLTDPGDRRPSSPSCPSAS